MKLTDGTIICEPIKFLSTVRPLYDKQGEVVGSYFIFNSHKLYFDDIDIAEEIRTQIAEEIPEAECVKKELEEKWEIPTSEEAKTAVAKS